MKYRPREGIVLLEIQGVHLLAATADDRKYCRFVREINETAAFIWNQLSKGMSVSEIEDVIKEQFNIDDDIDVKTDIDKYITCLIDLGYLVS